MKKKHTQAVDGFSVFRFPFTGRFTRGSQRDLKQFVRFATVVKRVEYNKGTDDFTVTAKNLKEDVETTERFSHVVVASGIFTVPKTPEIPGIERFRGRVLHSKNVKHLNEFKGQRMLLIGAAWSGEDLAKLCMKFGAKSVILSYKYQPWCPKWPEGIVERPIVERFQGNIAYFKDGTTAEVDVVLFCTGYQIEIPFMSEELRLKCNIMYLPDNLYKGVLWINGGNNKCMFIGMQYNIYCLNMFDAQAIWACRNIMGKIKLPPIEEMREDNVHWQKKIRAVSGNADFSKIGPFMTEYFKYIVESVDYNPDALEIENLLNQMLLDRSENICTWRDKQFKSIFSENLAPPPKVLYMENFDDSLETYVNQYWQM